jgi:hypothetical protein
MSARSRLLRAFRITVLTLDSQLRSRGSLLLNENLFLIMMTASLFVGEQATSLGVPMFSMISWG